MELLQSERSNDMFRDDIFGESPAGVRKTVSLGFLLLLRALVFC